MRKRICILLAVILLMLCMAACAKPTSSQVPTTVLPSGPVVDLGDTQGWTMAKRQEGAFSDEGYYHVKSASFLMFTDLKTATTVCLCSKPGCLHWEGDLHTMETCEANIAYYAGPMFFVSDNLYYFTSDAYGTQLLRRDAAGFAEETVCTVGQMYTKDEKSVQIDHMLYTDGYIYYDAIVSAPVWDSETGVSEIKDINYYIGRISLKNGKDEVLLEKDTQTNMRICAVRSGGLLYFTAQLPELDYEDPGYSEAFLNQNYVLNYWDLEKDQTTVVLQKPLRECQDIMQVHGEKIYFKEHGLVGNATYAYDMKSGIETLVAQNTLRHLGGGYALEKQDGEWEVLNMHTGQRFPFALSGITTVVSFSDKFCILRQSENQEDGSQKRKQSIVSYADLADGLQEADLLTFDTVINIS